MYSFTAGSVGFVKSVTLYVMHSPACCLPIGIFYISNTGFISYPHIVKSAYNRTARDWFSPPPL